MCTASWVHEDGGYQLLFNRDEKRTRLSADPPRVEPRDGVLTIAPVDGDHGGAWISVNERGIALCLLNGSYGENCQRSRGLLLNDLSGARTTGEALDRLTMADLSRYAAFTLVALETGRRATIAEWDGAAAQILEDGDAQVPLASSSFDAQGVRVKRREEFARIAGGGAMDATRLFEFHESHARGTNAYSPCMHRADAETVSFSWVTVSPSDVTFFYTPAAPCRWIPGLTVALPRSS